MKFHYFDQEKAGTNDIQLKMAIYQGYVPKTCLLLGLLVMSEVFAGKDPCAGCNGPREKCYGRPKSE